MTVVYPNMYCYEVCYKGIVLYSMELLCTILVKTSDVSQNCDINNANTEI